MDSCSNACLVAHFYVIYIILATVWFQSYSSSLGIFFPAMSFSRHALHLGGWACFSVAMDEHGLSSDTRDTTLNTQTY